MFTGIIEGIGKIKKVETLASSRRLWIEAPFSLSKEKRGDSIAVEGCCLTLTQKNGKSFSADVSPETLNRTTLGSFKKGMKVNLERPLTLQSRLGGHIVQGHVDGVGIIQSVRRVGAKHFAPPSAGRNALPLRENYLVIHIQFPKQLRNYLTPKGSIAVDGISLTVNEIRGNTLSICLIPHTQSLTTLTGKKAGDRVNLEVDVLAKYLEQLINVGARR